MTVRKHWWKLFAGVLVVFNLLTGITLAAGLQEFELVTEQEGWLLLDQRLYWTTTAGNSWIDITPPNLEHAMIWAVTFTDVQHGCLVFTDANESGNPFYGFARTSDSGATWQHMPLTMFAGYPLVSEFAAVYLHFLDAKTGWLVVKHLSSSNFSAGSLFRTTDGGQTWEQRPLPIGEPVFFITPEIGWTAGGATGQELYRTTDGGQAWIEQTVASLSGQTVFYRSPVFDNAQHGVLPVIVAGAKERVAQFYTTNDGGNSWTLMAETPLDQNIDPQAQLPLSVLRSNAWLMILPNTDQFLKTASTERSSDVKTTNIRTLKMASIDSGWGKYATGGCATSATGDTECTSETRLLRTTDGGQSWTSVNLPQADGSTVDTLLKTYSVRSSTPTTRASQSFQGQGFDKCEIGSLSQLQTWMNSSPYDAVNLYFGGACRSCGNTALTQSYVSQMGQQGWKFILTWVGRQSACSGYCSSYKISNDTTTAYNQGGAEADSAMAAAANLGLSNTIIYYDIEAYDTTNSTCRNAAKSFINGWSARLQSQGYEAGVYTSSCGGAIADYASIANVPNAIWVAAWYWARGVGQYTSDASVWNVSCLDNSLWANHQRLRQYAGEINETWGGVALNIDCDVIDGPVTGTGSCGSNLCGNVGGCTLSAGTYNLTCPIYVNAGSSLHIKPGVTLNYNGRSFTVNGQLIWGP